MPRAVHIVALGACGITYEVAFDGASRRLRGIRCAGAGVAIWAVQGGRSRLIAKGWLALPGGTSALEAEALACRLALRTLRSLGLEARVARFMGDNPIIIRHCGNVRNTRDPVVADTLDRPLASMALAGWTLSWSWVDRRANLTAHSAAREGARLARNLHDDPGGVRHRMVRFR